MFEISGSMMFFASFVIDPRHFINTQTFININIINKKSNSKIAY